MARKRTPAPAPEPTYTLIVYRPNGVEFSRTPAQYLSEGKPLANEAWRDITTNHGWMPTFRFLRDGDGRDFSSVL